MVFVFKKRSIGVFFAKPFSLHLVLKFVFILGKVDD
jgi:hypothetical protein